MAKNVSGLAWLLDATVAPFVSGMTKAIRSAENMATSVASSFAHVAESAATFGGIGAAIGAALSGAGIIEAVKGQHEATEVTTRLADRLGMTTEALTGLQYAASLAGVDSEALGAGLEKMQKKLGEAVEKGGEAAGAFARLGLNAKVLAAGSTSDAIGSIADKLQAIQNPAQRAYAITEIFGKSGQALGPLFAQGAAGIKAATAEAQRLGLSFNAVDSARLEEANQAIKRVEGSFTGVLRQLTIALAPAIASAADMIGDWGITVVGVVKDYLPGILNVATWVFEGVASIVTSVFGAIYGFISPIIETIVGVISDNWQSMLTTTIGYLEAYVGFIGTIFETVWNVVATVGGALVDTWNWAMTALGLSSATTANSTGGAFATIVKWGEWLASGITLALNTASFAMSHFWDIVDFASLSVAAALVTMGNQIEYTFVDVIGGYLVWLGENWFNIFVDMLNGSYAVLNNILTNAANFGKAIWSAIKGDGFNFDWTPLSQGFRSVMTDLPKIADRQTGALEQSLHDQASTIGNKIATDYSDYLAAQKKKAEDGAKAITDAGKSAVDKFHATLAAPAAQPKLKLGLDTDGAVNAAAAAKEKLDVIFSGSAESQQYSAKLAFEQLAAQATGAVGLASQQQPVAASAPTPAPVVAPLLSSVTGGADREQLRDTLQQMMTLFGTWTQYIRNLDEPLSQTFTFDTGDQF